MLISKALLSADLISVNDVATKSQIFVKSF